MKQKLVFSMVSSIFASLPLVAFAQAPAPTTVQAPPSTYQAGQPYPAPAYGQQPAPGQTYQAGQPQPAPGQTYQAGQPGQGYPAQQQQGYPAQQPQMQPAPTQPAPKAEAAGPGPKKNSLGLSLGFPSGGAPTAGVIFGVADNMALKLDVGLDIGKAENTKLQAGFSAEGGLRIYLLSHKLGPVFPFIQPGVWLSKAADGHDFGETGALQFNGGLGVEYFFTDHLSFSGVTGAGLRLYNGLGNWKLATGTSAIYVNIYW